MDIESIKTQLNKISESIQSEQLSIDESFEKLVIAMTSIFRLVNGEQQTLSALQGSPKELQGYVLNLVGQIRKRTSASSAQLIRDLDALLNQIGEK